MINANEYYVPEDVFPVVDFTKGPQTKQLYMTPEEFSQNWLVVGWMREKWQLARSEGSMLEVEVQNTPFGKYVLGLNVLNAK